ncbi:MAG: polysaccharide pyruvyl transferase family protein [Alphaproteobacteria bacterium]|nr:MAG: polysaccharide pyruvyl transferase family protein [Alphaproteobacteria bacterium]
MSRHRYVICGAIYSDNLGDGVIAECLAAALRQHDPASEIVFLDIAGRTHFGHDYLPEKQLALRILRILPRVARPVLVAALLAVRLVGWSRRWSGMIKPGDRVIIGGGNLLCDMHLNFPMKLAALDAVAHRKGAATALHAVGVSARWSRLAHCLFARVVGRAQAVRLSVRDEESRQHLVHHLNLTEAQVDLARDPGFLAAQVYTRPTEIMGGVGINLADPRELKFYTKSGQDTGFVVAEHLACWREIISRLIHQERRVVVFTNGAREDHEWLNEVVVSLGEHLAGSPYLTIMPRASTPAELVQQISGLDVLIAHRLHAHIVAYAMGIPAVGLLWDTKLESFFKLVDMPQRLIAPEKFGVEEIWRILGEVDHRPPDVARRMDLAEASDRVVAELIQYFDNRGMADAHGPTTAARADGQNSGSDGIVGRDAERP